MASNAKDVDKSLRSGSSKTKSSRETGSKRVLSPSRKEKMDEGISVVTKIPKITATTTVSASGTRASGKLKNVAASMASGAGVTSSLGLTSQDSPLDLIMSRLEAMESKISGEYRQTPAQTQYYEDQNNYILPYPSDHPDFYQYQQDLEFYDDEESLPLGQDSHELHDVQQSHTPSTTGTGNSALADLSNVAGSISLSHLSKHGTGEEDIFFLVFQNVIRLTNRIHVQ